MGEAIQTGLKKGLNITWQLSKILIPTYIIVTFLQYTPFIEALARYFEPILYYLGLPGKAALVLVLGNLINLYAAIGVIPALDFSFKEITILSLMLSFSHSLIVESAIAKKMGGSIIKLNFLRVGIAIISAFILNILW
ncbi:MAG TPA: nucleoside recognition protein [Eubacteriaceae bacterium]|nr:nucleoside recognition protein [Eubacteriaceae bacterium]